MFSRYFAQFTVLLNICFFRSEIVYSTSPVKAKTDLQDLRHISKAQNDLKK
jgi:hypothetical protein